MSRSKKKARQDKPSKEEVRARQEERRQELAVKVDQTPVQRFLSSVPSAVWVILIILSIGLLVFSFFYREMVTAIIAFLIAVFVERYGGKKVFRRYDEAEAERRAYFGLPATGELDLDQRNMLRRRQTVHSARRRHDNDLAQNAKKVSKKTGADYKTVLADLKAREMSQIMEVAERENEEYDRKHQA